MDKIQDIRAFEEVISDALNDFMENTDQYPSDAVLHVNSKSYELSIESPVIDEGIDCISLSELISIEDNEIDGDAVNELANKYFFVR